MKRLISLSPLIAVIGSLSSLLIAFLLSVSVAIRTVTLFVSDFWLGLGSEEATKALVVTAVEQADVILISAALLIIGIGLYALFVGRVERLPHWLDITSLDDLKDKLISVIVAVLAVNFFTRVFEWQGDNISGLNTKLYFVGSGYDSNAKIRHDYRNTQLLSL